MKRADRPWKVAGIVAVVLAVGFAAPPAKWGRSQFSGNWVGVIFSPAVAHDGVEHEGVEHELAPSGDVHRANGPAIASTLAEAIPAGWPAKRYQAPPIAQPAAAFELGRTLFYDPALSRDDTVSCGSCHQQPAAFAHARHRLSHGIGGQLGTRNAPPLFNLAWAPAFMWDGSIEHLELQPLAPIANPVEMGQPPAALADKLRAAAGYPERFEQAFGSPGIDTPRILEALAQFTGALISADAHYDRVEAGREAFTPIESKGLAVFRAHCASCHAEPLFTDFSFRSNGLDAIAADAGRNKISGDAADRGHFRVPSLRNVAVTAPYMHDGRFATLDAVLDHYDHGIVASPVLDPLLAKGVPLAAGDRAALLAFLHALTDTTLLTDPRFAEPAPAVTPVPPPTLAERLDAWTSHFFGFTADAHEGQDHGPEGAGSGASPPAHPTAVPPLTDDSPRLSLADTHVELVVARDGDVLRIWADDYATNAPLDDLAVSVASGSLLLRALAGDGTYTVPADRLDPSRANPLRILVRGHGWTSELSGDLPPVPRAHVARGGRPWGGATLFAGMALVAFAVLTVIRRRHAATAARSRDGTR